jgi:Cu2+-exporting ATPase
MMICAIFAFSTAFSQDAKKKDERETVVFKVNMTCENCVKKIEGNIAFEKGVTGLECDLKTHTAKVTYRKDKTTEDNLVSAFKKIGYTAEAQTDAKLKPSN